MYTLQQTESFEQEIRKSRFRAIACPVADESEAKARLAALSDPGANHNCWAWRIGQTYRFSDDGEPGGTAGKPILQAIDGQALDHALVVVTRWFGGILLGSGGLVRAYGGTAAACLRQAARMPLVRRVEVTVRIGFSDLSIVKARLAALSGVVTGAESYHDTGADLLLLLPEEEAEAILHLMRETTSGRVRAVDK